MNLDHRDDKRSLQFAAKFFARGLKLSTAPLRADLLVNYDSIDPPYVNGRCRMLYNIVLIELQCQHNKQPIPSEMETPAVRKCLDELGYTTTTETLAHEFIHAHQLFYKRLTYDEDGTTCWDGQRWERSDDEIVSTKYFSYPWEIEAYHYEKVLAKKYYEYCKSLAGKLDWLLYKYFDW